MPLREKLLQAEIIGSDTRHDSGKIARGEKRFDPQWPRTVKKVKRGTFH